MERKVYTDTEKMILYAEVDGRCPKCGARLYKVKDKVIRAFEVAHIYPLNPTAHEVEILKNEKLALFTCFIVGLIPAALETTMYIRMYELASLNILIITYLHIKNYDEEVLNLKELSIMGIAVVIGFST